MDAKLLILMETTKQKFGYLNQDHNCEAAKKEMAAFFMRFRERDWHFWGK